MQISGPRILSALFLCAFLIYNWSHPQMSINELWHHIQGKKPQFKHNRKRRQSQVIAIYTRKVAYHEEFNKCNSCRVHVIPQKPQTRNLKMRDQYTVSSTWLPKCEYIIFNFMAYLPTSCFEEILHINLSNLHRAKIFKWDI